MRPSLTRAATVAALLLAVGGPAVAQPPPAQPEIPARRLDRLDRTVRELNQIVRQGASTGRPVIVAPETLPAELDQLRTQFEDLAAAQRSNVSTIETLTAELAQARGAYNASQTQVTELQGRLAALEARLAAFEQRVAAAEAAAVAVPAAAPPLEEDDAPPPPPPPSAGTRRPGPAAAAGAATRRTDEGSLGSLRGREFPSEPAAAFQRARQQLLEGDYAGAALGFEDYATRFPDDPKAAEARYWHGETLYVRDDYQGAAQSYVAALRGWPTTGWAPDALVKLSSALVEIRQNDRACQTLDEFSRRYASAPAAVKARAERVRIRAACKA